MLSTVICRWKLTLYLLRHGQSHFNLHFNVHGTDPGIEDPELTDLGHAQARTAAKRLSGVRLTHILVSPFTRALQTAAPVIATQSATVRVMHEVRERAAFSCDIGSPRTVLAARFPNHDFDHLDDPWWTAGLESTEAVVARADAFRAFMAARPDDESTLLVSHWAFILSLTGRSVMNGEIIEYDPRSAPPRNLDWDS